MTQTADVVIVGGGIIGASIAYHLRQEGLTGRILVIERDSTYTRAATPLSMGGVRQQYSVPSNIALARYGVAFYERFDEVMAGSWGMPQAHFHQRGYLVLMHPANQQALLRRYEIQRQLGVEVQLLAPQDIQAMLPHLCVDEILGGIYGYRDGYLNPRGALQGFVERARELGCTWVQDDVTRFDAVSQESMQVQLRHGGAITTPYLVMAAGAWTPQLAALAGIDLPIVPVRRQGCYVTLPTVLDYKLPMILDRVRDISFRHDTETDNHLQITRTIRDEPPGFNFDWDSEAFATHIAPVIRHYLPDCGEVQLQRGWAGHYAVTPDENPIVGAHPVYPRLLMATGFSGHGLMLAPATGKVLAEMICHGQARTCEVSAYGLERFATGRLIIDPQI